MKFERLNLFHARHGDKFENIWSNNKEEGVKTYKVRRFMKSKFFQYTISCRGCDYIRTQTEFVFLIMEEIFLIARVFQLKAEKYPKMKISFEMACEFIKSLVCDFGKIDA